MKCFQPIAVLILIFLSPALHSQEMYRTVNGSIEIRGESDNGGLKATSNELLVRVDHETGEIFMRLDQSTLSSGVDSIDRKLDSLAEGPITFEGSFVRGGFDPNHCYSPTPLEISGSFYYGTEQWDVKAKGDFKSRFSNDRIPCLLEIGMTMDLKDADVRGFLPGFKKNVRIFILQALLNPEN